MRDWQARAVTFAQDLLLGQNASHMYLSAPTGTGKSRAIFEIVEALNVSGVHYLMVGMDAIMRQHRLSFLDYGCKLVSETTEADELLTPSGQRIIIETWQGLAAMARRLDPVEPCGFLIFDECHVGGSNEDNVSFPAIIAHLDPTKRLYVSATTQMANQKLLGEKIGHTFVYPLSEAYSDGLLNHVELVEVHSGTVGKVAKIEKAFGSDIERLEVLSASDLHALAEKLSDKDVALTEKSVLKIIEHRHKVMIDLYRRRHLGEQAIFYSPSIDAAEHAAAVFNRKNRRVTARAVHSEVPGAHDLIEQFRAGNVTALFVVGMLQEGFDMPSLRLAFDCRFYSRWTPSRIARVLQKIGRLMRVQEGKLPSAYYYARDITDFYTGGAVDAPEDLMIDDTAIMQRAAEGVAQVCVEASGGFDQPAWTAGEIEVEQDPVEEFDTEEGRMRLISSSLYLKAVSHGKIATTVNFTALFGRSSDEKKAALLAIEPGTPRPTRLSSSVVGNALSNYTSFSSAAYDADFDAAIRAKHPQWFFRENKADERKASLLAIEPGAPRPSRQSSSLSNALSNYTTVNNDAYDAEFDAAIRAKQPRWFRENAVADKKAALLAIEPGAPRPAQTTQLGKALGHYVLRSAGAYDPEFDASIRAKQPQWFDRVAAKKAALLAVEPGSPRPDRGKGNLGEALVAYTNKRSPQYDPKFEASIRAKQPHWFDRVGSKKTALLDIPVGSPRPQRGHPLRNSLGNYITPSNKLYDAEFHVAIRAKHPQWFRKST